MKFKDIPYIRPTVEEVNTTRLKQLEKFKNATTVDECISAYKEIENYSYNVVYTMWNLSYIRHTVDTTDEFYAAENDYWDEASPEMESLEAEITKALMQSSFRVELEREFGSLVFLNEKIRLKTFCDEIVEDLKEENMLTSEYNKLIASAQIVFNGETYNLDELEAYYRDPNREVRLAVNKVYRGWLLEKAPKIENIYDQLVKVRANIAKKLGHENFVETGYYRNQRTSYDKEMVKQFRAGIVEHIVPIVCKLKEEQKNRLGVETIKTYDDELMFIDGNAKPIGTPEDILNHARKMYHEMSTSTAEAWSFMQDHDLLDVMTRPGKSTGGYQTYLSAYGAPFIFANFNGTSEDISGMLTHEFGHAWASYLARDIFPMSLQYAPEDIAEIHAIAMEFLTWDWMEGFFGADTEKYYYTLLANHLAYLPYEVMVDEFQHHVYEKPEMTPVERNQLWLELEGKYRPWLDVKGAPFDGDGRRWQLQRQIFTRPFYYIDYALAGVVALSFWAKSRQNFTDAWNKYDRFTRLAGTKTFVELLEGADMPSPFVADNLKLVADEVKIFLEKSNLV